MRVPFVVNCYFATCRWYWIHNSIWTLNALQLRSIQHPYCACICVQIVCTNIYRSTHIMCSHSFIKPNLWYSFIFILCRSQCARPFYVCTCVQMRLCCIMHTSTDIWPNEICSRIHFSFPLLLVCESFAYCLYSFVYHNEIVKMQTFM